MRQHFRSNRLMFLRHFENFYTFIKIRGYVFLDFFMNFWHDIKHFYLPAKFLPTKCYFRLPILFWISFFSKDFCIFKNYHMFVKWQKLSKFLVWHKFLSENVARGSKKWPRHNLHPNTLPYKIFFDLKQKQSHYEDLKLFNVKI